MKKTVAGAIAAAVLGCAMAQAQPKVTVSNPSDFDRTELIEISCAKSIDGINMEKAAMLSQQGDTLPCQIAADGNLLFIASVPANCSAQYTLIQAETPADTLACGRIYPRRQDDLGWENDVVAFRAYGPGTTARGEKMYGYDLFLKRGTTKPVLESLYAGQLDPENWRIVNGLHAQGLHAQADSVQNSFTYHVDHGYGMDCYAVGASLGAGATALLSEGHLAYPGCFADYEIIENGPLRFKARLKYAPQAYCNDTVTEVRVITLDAGSNLCKTEVTYQGLTNPAKVAAGMRADTIMGDESMIWYLDPTQGSDNGELYVGCLMAKPGEETISVDGNTVIVSTLQPDESLEYYWGYGWNRNQMPSLEAWKQYLQQRQQAIANPMTTTPLQ